MPHNADLLVIGGGPAGMAAALVAARQRHRALVIDSAKPPEERWPHMHAVPTWDHEDPMQFLQSSRENILKNYDTVGFIDAKIEGIRKLDDSTFEASSAGESWTGRKIILAMGVSDVFPAIDGYAECWPSGIFHCLVCHGYEERDSLSSGVLCLDQLGTEATAMHVLRQCAQITTKVIAYTNGNADLTASLTKAIVSTGTFAVDSRQIQRLEKSWDRAKVVIHFQDGSTVTEAFLAHRPGTKLRGSLTEQLGCNLAPHGGILVTPPYNKTSIHGVFAAGDVTSPMRIVTNAMFTGTTAAAGALSQLQAEKHGHASIVS